MDQNEPAWPALAVTMFSLDQVVRVAPEAPSAPRPTTLAWTSSSAREALTSLSPASRRRLQNLRAIDYSVRKYQTPIIAFELLCKYLGC